MGKRLYVGNLSFDTTEESIRNLFADGGRNVLKVDIVTDSSSGRSRGFAFVEMESEEEAAEAMSTLDGVQLDDRPIRVNEARERAQQSRRSGTSKRRSPW